MLVSIMGKNKDWPITVRLEEDEYRYVTRLSASEDRSLSAVARYLLKWGIDQHRKEGQLVYKDEPPPAARTTDPKAKPAPRAGKKEKTEDRKTGTLG